jgi:hypothetical protein
MIKAYLIQKFPIPGESEYYSNHINKIKEENPNLIVIISLGEIDVEYLFGPIMDGVTNWLVENNRMMYVLWAGPDKELRPNIRAVNTLGSAMGNMHCTMGCQEAARQFNLVKDSTKLFTCYNNNAKVERLMLVDSFAKHNLLKEGIVTYRYPQTRLRTSWKYHDGSRLFDEEDYTISSKPEYSPGYLPRSYMTGFIDIVTETDCQEGYFIPTEKTAKPLGALKPFLVLSSKNYHQWLYDEYGIEKYDEIFDYSFDNKSSIEDRIQGIVDNLIRIKKLISENPNYKAEIYKALKRKLLENRYKSINILEILKAKNKIIPNCMRFILTEEYELCGDVVNSNGGYHFLTDKEWLQKHV